LHSLDTTIFEDLPEIFCATPSQDSVYRADVARELFPPSASQSNQQADSTGGVFGSTTSPTDPESDSCPTTRTAEGESTPEHSDGDPDIFDLEAEEAPWDATENSDSDVVFSDDISSEESNSTGSELEDNPRGRPRRATYQHLASRRSKLTRTERSLLKNAARLRIGEVEDLNQYLHSVAARELKGSSTCFIDDVLFRFDAVEQSVLSSYRRGRYREVLETDVCGQLTRTENLIKQRVAENLIRAYRPTERTHPGLRVTLKRSPRKS